MQIFVMMGQMLSILNRQQKKGTMRGKEGERKAGKERWKSAYIHAFRFVVVAWGYFFA